MKNKRPTILVTGFGAFQEFETNPSEDIAKKVNGQISHGMQVVGLTLPVSWTKAWPLIQKAILRHKPSGLLMFGLAPGHWFRLERVAINRNEPYFDVEYNRPPSVEIIPEGATTMESTLPLDWLYEEIQNFPGQRVPEVRYSEDAGGYLCNNVYYNAMNRLENVVPCRGFIHVPAYPMGDAPAEWQLSQEEILEVGVFLVERFSYWISGQFSINA